MKTRGVIGARIDAVRQERRQANHGPVSHIVAIEGTNHAPGRPVPAAR